MAAPPEDGPSPLGRGRGRGRDRGDWGDARLRAELKAVLMSPECVCVCAYVCVYVCVCSFVCVCAGSRRAGRRREGEEARG